VFFRDGDSVFRTYFINNRGDEAMAGTWSYPAGASPDARRVKAVGKPADTQRKLHDALR
jgi:predicted dithiol-disulfide oxidoreductase (DUF899 family)